MAGRSRPPPAAAVASSSSGLERPWGGPAVGPPGSPGEEANPFSFKEFVRSKNQNVAAATVLEAKSAGDVTLESGAGSSPKDPLRFSFLLDDSSLSPGSLGLGLREPFAPDLMATNSLLEAEDDDNEWSSTYQPSAVEEAALGWEPSASLSSTYDSFYGNPSDLSELHSFSPWKLVGKEDQSSPGDGTVTGGGFYPSRQLSYEELKEENSKLRSKISHLQAVSEARAERVKELERTLEESKWKEEREARDLEAMVQQVEENLERMTKRAMKAETSTVKLKQENTLLQVQMENYRLGNEALKSGHLANLAVVKQNADVALQNLLTVITKSRSSVKQLLSGAEELQLVAELLKSIDKISEVPQASP
ncbi:endosome-associated-trafficking regulator 1 isoform X1 [Rhineura floridana]|uniref:endosome-associated-trafficking regulator 1 isoform X1 n=1 Tax=Rhineura floridana TaxID=261503 RepID=UPI002AC7EDF7|nr:endosome-associated-trafficking regulator 1 isoform X1 [Rhineura floridana]